MRGLAMIALVAGCGRIGFGLLGPGDGTTTGDGLATILRVGDRADADIRDVADTWVQVSQPDNNMGSHEDVHIRTDEGYPALFRFAIGGATTRAVVSAKLHLWVYQDSIGTMTSLEVTRMLEPWVEGTGNFTPGAASCNERMPGVAWATSCGDAPGSRDPTVIAQTMGPFGPGDEVVLDIPPATIESWIADPASNHGIAIDVSSMSSEYFEVFARESSEETQRPLLVVQLAP